MTPFVATRRAAVAAELHAWLGLPPSVRLQAAERWSEGAVFEGELHHSGSALRFVLRDGEGSAWRADGLSLTCVPERPLTAGHKALLRMLHARFTAEGVPAAAAGLRERLQSVWFFHNNALTDWNYVSLERTTHGLRGSLRLGYRCNQDCYICPQSRQWPDPPADLTRRWVDELAAEGLTGLTITGGEPTTYRHLPDVVARATAHGMDVLLQTNAVALSRPRYLARLRGAGLQRLFVSFHSHVPEISDAITRAPGTHRQTVAGIHAALSAGMFVALNCCVDARNVDTLADHARYIVENFRAPYGADGVAHVEHNQPGYYYNKPLMKGSMVPLSRVSGELIAALDVLVGAGIQVHPFGTCGFPLCTVRQRPAVTAWPVAADLDAQNRRSKQFPAACEGCAAAPHCSGVRPEYIDLHGTENIQPYTTLPAISVKRDYTS